MKTIQLLSVLIALAVFTACSGKSDEEVAGNPVGPDVLASDESNAIPAASLGQAVEYEPYVSDSLTVSFEGTKIRIFNTSGGTRLLEHKPWIWDIDWNVQAWNPDSTLVVDLMTILKAPEWHPVKAQTNNLNFTIYCPSWPDLWWNGPTIGYNSGLSDDVLVMFRNGARNGVLEDGSTYQGTWGPDTRFLNSCLVELDIRIQYVRLGAGIRYTDRDTWTLQHNEFTFPQETEIHDYPDYAVAVIYHPIVPDSSYIESETAWLNGLLEYQHVAFRSQKMLPVTVFSSNRFGVIEGALVVPPDTTTTGFQEDEVFLRAVEKLRDEYPHGVGFKKNRSGNYYVIRTGIMSERMAEMYGNARFASRGRGYVGQPWSVFLYERKRPYGLTSQTFAHEIGHNFGLMMLPRFNGRFTIWDSGRFLEAPFEVCR